VSEHACVTCRALPELPPGVLLPPKARRIKYGYRPVKPLPAPHGGPRSRRCDEHERAHKRAARKRASDRNSRKRSGLDEETRQEVLALQGGRCPCGAAAKGRRLNLNADHNHELAREHDHADDVACEDCFEGFTCHHCNREVIGYLSWSGNRGRDEVATALENLAAYLRDPPMARLRRQRAATELEVAS
jgi:hypothetical protein